MADAEQEQGFLAKRKEMVERDEKHAGARDRPARQAEAIARRAAYYEETLYERLHNVLFCWAHGVSRAIEPNYGGPLIPDPSQRRPGVPVAEYTATSSTLEICHLDGAPQAWAAQVARQWGYEAVEAEGKLVVRAG